jgi:hypothetical protein
LRVRTDKNLIIFDESNGFVLAWHRVACAKSALPESSTQMQMVAELAFTPLQRRQPADQSLLFRCGRRVGLKAARRGKLSEAHVPKLLCFFTGHPTLVLLTFGLES